MMNQQWPENRTVLTVYPKNYAHGLYFVVFCCGEGMVDF